jgi:hypothetical protein
MNYRLTNFEIKQAQGARISGQESNGYLSCTAFNPMNRFEKSHNIAIFDPGMIAYYKTKLPIGKGGALPDEGWDENAMDPKDRVFVNGCTVEYDLGAEYCRKYTSDIVDADDNPIPGKQAGDFIKDANGQIIHFQKISVFCQYCFKTEALIDDFGMPIIDPATGASKIKILRDENGKPIEQWVDGWTPQQVGESMRRLLTPYNPAMEPGIGAAGNPSGAAGVAVQESPDVFGDGAGAGSPAGAAPGAAPGAAGAAGA